MKRYSIFQSPTNMLSAQKKLTKNALSVFTITTSNQYQHLYSSTHLRIVMLILFYAAFALGIHSVVTLPRFIRHQSPSCGSPYHFLSMDTAFSISHAFEGR